MMIVPVIGFHSEASRWALSFLSGKRCSRSAIPCAEEKTISFRAATVTDSPGRVVAANRSLTSLFIREAISAFLPWAWALGKLRSSTVRLQARHRCSLNRTIWSSDAQLHRSVSAHRTRKVAKDRVIPFSRRHPGRKNALPVDVEPSGPGRRPKAKTLFRLAVMVGCPAPMNPPQSLTIPVQSANLYLR